MIKMTHWPSLYELINKSELWRLKISLGLSKTIRNGQQYQQQKQSKPLYNEHRQFCTTKYSLWKRYKPQQGITSMCIINDIN